MSDVNEETEFNDYYRYLDWEETEKWISPAILIDIGHSTTDDRLKELAEEYSNEARNGGVRLDSRILEILFAHRKKIQEIWK